MPSDKIFNTDIRIKNLNKKQNSLSWYIDSKNDLFEQIHSISYKKHQNKTYRL